MLSVEQINLLQGQNEGLKKQNAELQRENAELKADNEQLKKDKIGLHSEIKQLEQENARLKEENDKLNKMTGIFSARLCKKYYVALQEIKAIVCGNYEIIDPQGRKDILKLITKAEEQTNEK